ncbi:uncharacterized protein LOC122064319 [Macadamia integrifolia]|uniref:uncharacterized protein LOC122064319 n=1 Tax=Macadamia integrifolia TaxID=60698 RepID=UPI001C4EBCF9|nr:uncharacterized protein LOC122064319 [Macadamia integrifolia]
MENTIHFQKLCQVETRRMVLLMAILASVVIVIQSFGLPYGNVLWSLFPVGKNSVIGNSSSPSRDFPPKPSQIGDMTLNESNPVDLATVLPLVNNTEDLGEMGQAEHQNVKKKKDDSLQNDITLEKDMDPDKASHFDGYQTPHNESSSREALNPDKSITLQHVNATGNGSTLTKPREPENSSGDDGRKEDKTFVPEKGQNMDTDFAPPLPVSPQVVPSANTAMPKSLESNSTNHITSVDSTTSVSKQEIEALSKDEKPELSKGSQSNLHSTSTETKNPVAKAPKREKSPTSVASISEMSHLLSQSRATSFAMRPRWSSIRDKELLSARVQIENAPIIRNNQDLYAPLFRNVSMFIRSLPETYVRYPKDPLRGLGGNPPSKRPILAFFAGNMHGYVRPILLQYWENRDPDMKIFGQMGHGSKDKVKYINYMKSSKYCICAKGYEVNSPRVVEAIFYECIPVILSDNFVPPFFDVLEWESFAVFVPEKDIPNLKEILLSIPEARLRQLQLRVKKVQKHFLWHSKPVKYDLFHMILHSIWYNRVFQIRV